MNTRGMWGVGVWGFLVAGVFAGAWAVVVPLGGPMREPLAVGRERLAVGSEALVARNAAYRAESLGSVAVNRDPFRVERRPAVIGYDPARVAAPVATAAPPKPMLALVGIVAGAEPTAVIEGFPGVEGARVVRVGDVVGGLTVKRITDNAVRISGMDTTWVLKVREPWKD